MPYGFLGLVSWLQRFLFPELPSHLGFAAVPAWWPLPLLTLSGLLASLSIHYLPGNCVHPALCFLLPRRSRERGELDLPHEPTATVGQLVQSVGVPLTEVRDLVVAGVSVSWRSRLQEQDRLDVIVRARPQPLEGSARFLLDVHLDVLTRRLRLLGVDAAYDKDADDAHLVELAERARLRTSVCPCHSAAVAGAWGSTLQLLLNVTVLTAVAVVGLPVQRAIWRRATRSESGRLRT
jgi:hypothetical protein